MTTTDDGMQPGPLLVHITGSDLPAPDTTPPRLGGTLTTFTLTDKDPVQRILPTNLWRREALLQALDADVQIATTRADAQSGAGVTIPVANTGPYPLHITDEIWATAATLPARLSVAAVVQ